MKERGIMLYKETVFHHIEWSENSSGGIKLKIAKNSEKWEILETKMNKRKRELRKL